jgi:hypothetical protein
MEIIIIKDKIKKEKKKRKKKRSPTTKLNKSLEHGLNLSRS